MTLSRVTSWSMIIHIRKYIQCTSTISCMAWTMENGDIEMDIK